MRSLKLLIVLIGCTGFVFGFSQIGGILAGKWLPENTSFAEETMIANEEVSNHSKDEAAAKLEKAKNEWVTNDTIYLEWTGELLPFPKDAFIYQIPETIDFVESGSENGLKVELPIGKLLEQIETIAQSSDIFSSLDSETLKKDMENVASQLKEGDHTFSLANYLTEEGIAGETSLIAEVSLSGTSSVEEMTDVFGNLEFIIPGNTSFSVNEWIKNEHTNLSDEAASIFASLVYELIGSTNFHISERHISIEMPLWASEGYEVLIQKDKMDFVFHNPNPNDYKLTFKTSNSKISGELNGGPLPYEYIVTQVERKTLSPKTIVQYSATLPSNRKNVKENGRDGTYIHLVRTATDMEGNVVESTVYSEDFYAPIQRVEQHSLSTPAVVSNPIVTTPPVNIGSNTGTNSNTVTPPGASGPITSNTGSNTNTSNNTNSSGSTQSNTSVSTGTEKSTAPSSPENGNGGSNTGTTPPSNPGQGTGK
ncbi:hypothetical protein [Bacillus sp. CHD6a]|uniref:hypothetical protein n=1 Tax=Bacillus sp. CHD6a TaxID=1643452 RepID=UPI0006CC6CE0|nr:hypothetical protein [Bacillus sp. CHD6a]KPB05525.1 hypothetical protein AAV98_07255 [Bacillus sp. CHD6a]